MRFACVDEEVLADPFRSSLLGPENTRMADWPVDYQENPDESAGRKTPRKKSKLRPSAPYYPTPTRTQLSRTQSASVNSKSWITTYYSLLTILQVGMLLLLHIRLIGSSQS